MIKIKTSAEIDKMRRAGQLVAEILQRLKEEIAPGITSLELDILAEEECRRHHVIPAFKGYGGFPYTICASPNDRVVHGFPNRQPLKEGEILSIDFGLIADGFYGDSALTCPVGKIDSATQGLLDATRTSLMKGIAQARPGARLGDISAAVQQYAEQAGYSVVREFVGHGIGRALHEDPQVPNFGRKGTGPQLKEGMALAIEPMINAGTHAVRVLDDGWTAVTRDGGLSAHFEHTIAITAQGPEILTQLDSIAD